MILYEYRCRECSEVTEALREVNNRNDAPTCKHCNGRTKKIISSQNVHSDFDPYYDDNLESYVKSKQHRKKLMREKGVSEAYGKGWV